MNKWGIHVSNGPLDYADLERMLALGCSNYTLLHYQCDYLPRLREASPDGLLLFRFYDTGYLGKNATDYARRVADALEPWVLFTKDVVFANEMNLEMESGPGFNDVQRVTDWIVVVAEELKRLCPWMQIHAPAFSPWGNWTEYYRRLAPHVHLFDAIDIHTYGALADMVNITHNAMLWFPEETRFFVSELNGSGSLEYFRWCEFERRILGATYFIWHWANPDDPNWNRDLRNSPLEQQIREAEKKEIVMGLAEQYPELYQQWVGAGGPENNFRKHLLGIGAIKPSADDLKMLADELGASAAQMKGALDSFFQ